MRITRIVSPCAVLAVLTLTFPGGTYAQQGGAAAHVQDPLLGVDNNNPMGWACLQGISTVGEFILSPTPGSVSVSCGYAGGTGSAFGSWNFGSINSAVSVSGGYSPGSNCCDAAFVGAGGIFEDFMLFQFGFIPYEVMFHFAYDLSRGPGVIGAGAQIGTSFDDRVFINGLFPNSTGTGTATFPVLGNSLFRFFGFSTLTIESPYYGIAHGPDYAAAASSSFRITGIQFFSNGIDVTGELPVTFASGHSYHLGAPVSVVPEPESILLLATGLIAIGFGLQRRRRNPRQE